MAADALARWTAALDACAERMETARQALVQVRSVSSEPFVPALFTPPADLPPCPPELAPRLQQLQGEIAATIELARNTLQGLSPVAAAAGARHLARAADASLMDTRL